MTDDWMSQKIIQRSIRQLSNRLATVMFSGAPYILYILYINIYKYVYPYKNVYNTKKKIMRKWNSSNSFKVKKKVFRSLGISMYNFQLFQRGSVYVEN